MNALTHQRIAVKKLMPSKNEHNGKKLQQLQLIAVLRGPSHTLMWGAIYASATCTNETNNCCKAAVQ